MTPRAASSYVSVALIDDDSGDPVGDPVNVRNGGRAALTPTSGQSIRLTDANAVNQNDPFVTVHYTNP